MSDLAEQLHAEMAAHAARRGKVKVDVRGADTIVTLIGWSRNTRARIQFDSGRQRTIPKPMVTGVIAEVIT